MRVLNNVLLSFSFSLIVSPSPIAQKAAPNPDDDSQLSIPKPSTSKPGFLTILTDADVTWCRPWPNTALFPQNSINIFKDTPVKLACWTRTDRLGNNAGESEPWDIWVRTEGHGCYINENDLRSTSIDFEKELNVCKVAGPHQISGNRPEGYGVSAPPSPLPQVVASPAPPPSPLPPPFPLPPAEPLPAISVPKPAEPLFTAVAVPPVVPLPAVPDTPAIIIPAVQSPDVKPVPLFSAPFPQAVNGTQPLVVPNAAIVPSMAANSTKTTSRRRTAAKLRL